MFNVGMVSKSIQSLPERLRTIVLDLNAARIGAELDHISKKLMKIANELETFNSENAEVNKDSEPCRYP